MEEAKVLANSALLHWAKSVVCILVIKEYFSIFWSTQIILTNFIRGFFPKFLEFPQPQQINFLCRLLPLWFAGRIIATERVINQYRISSTLRYLSCKLFAT
jgi:hypothetical protein